MMSTVSQAAEIVRYHYMLMNQLSELDLTTDDVACDGSCLYIPACYA